MSIKDENPDLRFNKTATMMIKCEKAGISSLFELINSKSIERKSLPVFFNHTDWMQLLSKERFGIFCPILFYVVR
jgi:hypothetical protein